jgi:hypothetical protein
VLTTPGQLSHTLNSIVSAAVTAIASPPRSFNPLGVRSASWAAISGRDHLR